jgi:murein L,D-transpeptidase YcbB/YkuD
MAYGRNAQHAMSRSTNCGWLTLVLLLLMPSLAAAQAAPRIESLVTAGVLPGMQRPDFTDYQPSVREFYSARAYAPAWLQGRAFTPTATALLGRFQNAWQKGLEPDDYDAPLWEARRQQLDSPDADVAAIDLALTVSAMRYISDLRVGRVNPRHLKFDLPVEQKKYDLAEFLAQRVLPAADPSSALDGVEPPFAGYERTEGALLRYIELAREDDASKLPLPPKAVEPGQTYAGVPRLAQLLRLVGDLAPAAQPEGEHYDGALVEAVRSFQRRHGLDADGRLGPSTIQELNVPLADRVTQIKLTLERWRWVPVEFPAPPIIVNIPEFRLRALDASNAVALEMRVVVGKAMRTETPVFIGDMRYVVFRPFWNVPPGILRRTVVPAIRRDPGYLAKNRYEITTTGGTVVTTGAVSDEVLAQLSAGKLFIRQKPGPDNALGLVKLMFPNEHAVYLHSTPATELFARTRRDFSSGCIRVERPAELTAWVLRNNPGWPVARVEEAMQSGRDNVTVNLAQRVPVLIIYGTAVTYPDGEVHFYQDLYGHDARLKAALEKRDRT